MSAINTHLQDALHGWLRRGGICKSKFTVRAGTEFESPAFCNMLLFRLKVDIVMGWYWTHSSVRVLGCLTLGTSAF